MSLADELSSIATAVNQRKAEEKRREAEARLGPITEFARTEGPKWADELRALAREEAAKGEYMASVTRSTDLHPDHLIAATQVVIDLLTADGFNAFATEPEPSYQHRGQKEIWIMVSWPSPEDDGDD